MGIDARCARTAPSQSGRRTGQLLWSGHRPSTTATDSAALQQRLPAERSADPRDYYDKHSKSDRLDSVPLARLSMLHPEGLRPQRGPGPGDPLRRATKLHSTVVKRRTTSLARLNVLLEILGLAWRQAFKATLGIGFGLPRCLETSQWSG